MSPHQLVSLIQSSISDSLHGELAPLQSTVSTLAQQNAEQQAQLQAHQGQLNRVERAITGQQTALADMDTKHNKRTDHPQGEIVQIQTALRTPPSNPNSREASGSPTSSPTAETSFDIVLGGWEEGETREWVDHNVGKLLQAAEVQEDILRVNMFGKRPTHAKLVLQVSHLSSLQAKREKQTAMLTKLRGGGWQVGDRLAWITTDKTPRQRQISKAIAKLNGFLVDALGATRDQLDIAFWPAGKTFIGKHRMDLGIALPCDLAGVRWLVQDPKTSVCVWVELAALSASLGLDLATVAQKWKGHFGPPRQ